MAKATSEGGGGGGVRVIKSSGAILPDMDKALHLLPLAPNPSAVLKAGPPLERLPMGHPRPDRIAFTSQSSQRSWVASTHFFPAAYPRSHFAATAPPSEAPPASLASTASQTKEAEREQRKADFETFEDLVSRFSFESYYPPESVEEAKKIAEGLVREDQPPLWGSVQRIVPVDNGSKYGARDARAAGTADAQDKEEGLTLILAHANGFHKEVRSRECQARVTMGEARAESWVAHMHYTCSLSFLDLGNICRVAGQSNRSEGSVIVVNVQASQDPGDLVGRLHQLGRCRRSQRTPPRLGLYVVGPSP